MAYRYLLALIVLAFPVMGFSRIERADSISLGIERADSIRQERVEIPDSVTSMIDMQGYLNVYEAPLYPLMQYQPGRVLDLQIPDMGYTPGQAPIFNWSGGQIAASGSVMSLPGMMQIDRGAIGVYQSAGRFTFHLEGMANKYGYYRGLHTQYGIGGSVGYRISSRLSATVFGEYYFGAAPMMANGMPMPPSMIGYYGRSAFGGYLDYQINDHWGVQTGVQTVQQVGTRRYQAEPIVTPYYKISKKVAIGLPVGQILYHILKK